MREFIGRLYELAKPYKMRLLAGILTGILCGAVEPLLPMAMTFVINSFFPSEAARENPYLLGRREILAPERLASSLADAQRPLAEYLRGQLTPETRELVDRGNAPASELEPALVQALNGALARGPLFDASRFEGVSLSKATRALMERRPSGEQLVRLNRLLLEDAYPGEIAKMRTSVADFLGDRLGFATETVRRWGDYWRIDLTRPGRPDLFKLAVVASIIPLIMFLRGVLGYLNIYCLQWVAIRAVTDLRIRVFNHLTNLSVSFFNRVSTGELMSRLTADSGTLQNIFSNSLATAIKDPVTVVFIVVFLFWWYPVWSMVTLTIFPVCAVPFVIYTRKVRKSAKLLQQRYADLSRVMQEAFTANRIVKAYNLEGMVADQFAGTARQFITHYMRIIRSVEIPGPLIECIGTVGMGGFFVFIALSSSRPTIADFSGFVLAVYMLYRPLKAVTRLQNQIEQARAASAKIFLLLGERSDIQKPAHPFPLSAAGAPIRFEQVSFSFGDKPVLRDIDLTVEPGKLVALVGASGSGKTTLTHLLLRFYDAQSGTIRIGGTDIREVDPAELRRQIAVVTQETILFFDTIRNNIAMGRSGASTEDILAAARHAHAHEFILERENGYGTMIGERGVQLSGGQRQRLAIARAILKDAPILVLDEATSALDSESERAVQAALEVLMQGRTTLCIAHRLSTIFKADRIVVMDQGRIVESGTHEELLNLRGHYHKLYTLQYGE